jgi:hypothetical protein
MARNLPKRAKRIFALTALTVAVFGFTGVSHPVLATEEPITAADNIHFSPDTQDQDPGDFVVTGFEPSTVLLVGVNLLGPDADTTFRLTATSGLIPAYGYTFSPQLRSISFTGTQSDVNSSLSTLLISTGVNGGPFTLRVSAAVNQPNTYFNPINEHFYQYISSPNITWVNARSSAQVRTFNGATGYLVNITSEEENDFIAQNINAENIWIGASDLATEGNWIWMDGPEAGVNFWQGTARGSSPSGTSWFSHWAINQPDDSSGNEDFAVTNWRGTRGQWNDLAANGASLIRGYLTEFDGGTTGFTDFFSEEISAVIGYPPRNVNVQPRDEEVTVTWDAPEDVTATRYSVTASPDGAICTVTGSSLTGNSCTISGLNAGTEYTFTVTAFYADGSTSVVSSSVTPTAPPSTSTTTTSPTTTSNINSTTSPAVLPVTGSDDPGRGSVIAFWLFVIGVGMILAVRCRRGPIWSA